MKGIGKGILYFVAYFALTMGFQFLLSAGTSAIAVASGLNEEAEIAAYVNHNLLGITLISGLLTGLTFYLFFKLRKKQVKKEWKLNRCKRKDVVLASVISFSFSFLFTLITYNVTIENSVMIAQSANFVIEKSTLLGILLLVLSVLIVAPMTEEIVLRGIVYTRIEKTTNAITAIVVSSVLFGLMHIPAGGILVAIGATLMSFVWGYLFYKTDSLWVCIFAHAAANLPDIILLNKPKLSEGVFFGLLISFAILFLGGIYMLQKTTSKRKA